MNLTPSSSSGGMSLNPTVTLLQAKDVNVYYPYGTRFSDVFATTTDRYQYSGMKELQNNNKSEINRKQFNNARKEYWKNEYPEKQTK